MKRALLIIAAAVLLLFPVSCGIADNAGGRDGIVTAGQSKDTEPDPADREILKDIYKNSSLPAKLYSAYSDVPDAGDMENAGEYSSVFTLINERNGCEFKLYGADRIEDCVVISVKWTSPAYAFYGLTVGDSPDDLEIILPPLGFEERAVEGVIEYTRGGVSVTVTEQDGRITSFTICRK